jgi:hypothetical protein
MMLIRVLYHYSSGTLTGLPVGSNDEDDLASANFREQSALPDGIPPVAMPGNCYFDIHRAEHVSLTSVFFSGNDWHWTFHAPSGATLAQSNRYSSEEACLAAVAALRSELPLLLYRSSDRFR